MTKTTALLFSAAAVGAALGADHLDDIADTPAKFGAWQRLFGGEPGSLAAFAANDKRITAHNAAYAAGNSTYWLGHNRFSGLTNAEFVAHHLSAGAAQAAQAATAQPPLPSSSTLPPSVDWVKQGAVTAVVNSEQSGGGNPFYPSVAVAGAMEGAFEIAGHPLTSFSAGQLTKCFDGITVPSVWDWLSKNGGICTDAAFKADACACKPTPGTAPVTGAVVAHQNDTALAASVAAQPTMAIISASSMAFQSYAGGVISASGCGTQLDHGVLVTGYGTDGATPYYTLKNSWGASWGEGGYVRLQRGGAGNGKGTCGLLLLATHVVLGK